MIIVCAVIACLVTARMITDGTIIVRASKPGLASSELVEPRFTTGRSSAAARENGGAEAMRVRPRQQLLEVWESVVRSSWRDGGWNWGGRDGSNSISDAEQILCLLLPATQIESFNLDRPDQTSERMVQVLRRLGTATDIPRVLVDVFTDYLYRYTDKDGTPVFSGGSYFSSTGDDEPTESQREYSIVDSFAISITLSLATIGFARVFRRSVTREDVRARIATMEELASKRLSAAMVGLLRSFTVNVFPVDSSQGRALIRTANQAQLPPRALVSQLHRELRQTIASFREVLIGSGQTTDLESPDRLFECGWSWGVVHDAPAIEVEDEIGEQAKGVAEDAPYLYFTVIALDAIEDLFSERTRILGLLNEEQQRLSRALQLRWELTRTYWATVATFGNGARWPLEDIPWRTTDEAASEYFTLQVTSLAVKGLERVRGTDAELTRVGRVLAALAERVRITSRPMDNDQSLALHVPGVLLSLRGSESEGGPRLRWRVSEFSTLLLQRSASIAGLISDSDGRGELLDLSDRIWDHLARRRLESGTGAGLWDQPRLVFEKVDEEHSSPSWYFTERAVQGLINVAKTLGLAPIPSEPVGEFALDLIREAEQIYDQELLNGSGEGAQQLRDTLSLVNETLRRAREILPSRPGTSAALAIEMLRNLDRLAAARGTAAEEA
jgi:hypothetical protein